MRRNAGPSTEFGSENEPNSAQDDIWIYDANYRLTTLGSGCGELLHMFGADFVGGKEAQEGHMFLSLPEGSVVQGASVCSGLNSGAAGGLFALDDANHCGDNHAGFLRSLNGGDGGGAGGANIVDDDHARALAAEAFDAAAGAMSLLRFADEEAVQQWRVGCDSARQALAVATLETMGSAPMVRPPTASASILLASSSSRMAWPVRRPPSACSVVVRQSM